MDNTCATCATCAPWQQPSPAHLGECGRDNSTGAPTDTCAGMGGEGMRSCSTCRHYNPSIDASINEGSCEAMVPPWAPKGIRGVKASDGLWCDCYKEIAPPDATCGACRHFVLLKGSINMGDCTSPPPGKFMSLNVMSKDEHHPCWEARP